MWQGVRVVEASAVTDSGSQTKASCTTGIAHNSRNTSANRSTEADCTGQQIQIFRRTIRRARPRQEHHRPFHDKVLGVA